MVFLMNERNTCQFAEKYTMQNIMQFPIIPQNYSKFAEIIYKSLIINISS